MTTTLKRIAITLAPLAILAATASPAYQVLTVRSRYAAAFRRPASALAVEGWLVVVGAPGGACS